GWHGGRGDDAGRRRPACHCRGPTRYGRSAARLTRPDRDPGTGFLRRTNVHHEQTSCAGVGLGIMRSPLYPRRLVAVFAIILGIALVVRAPFIAVAPIVTELGGLFDLDATQLGLLTGLPVICFAILTPLASTLIGRVGANFATTLMILGCTLGIIV